MLECRCVFDAAGHLVMACGCIPQRIPEPRGTVEKIYRRDEWECRCIDAWTNRRLSKYRRHRSEIDCVDREALDAFKEKHGLKNDCVAKALLFIESFGA